jgi:magnesium-transporting ATPase (P-type)
MKNFKLRVGQIVKIMEGHNFPADLVILTSSETLGMGIHLMLFDRQNLIYSLH